MRVLTYFQDACARRAIPVASPPMFVLLLTYTAPLAEVDAFMRRHMAWLDEHYDAGRFLVSGRRIPRTGGVILARRRDPAGIEGVRPREPLVSGGGGGAEIEAIAASDPFVTGGVAACEVIEFRASQTAPGFDPEP